MAYNLPEKITTEKDVYDFFRYIFHVENTWFHPDDSFSGYIDIYTKKPAFNEETCKKYDDLMEQAHQVCSKINPGRIYEIGMEVNETAVSFSRND